MNKKEINKTRKKNKETEKQKKVRTPFTDKLPKKRDKIPRFPPKSQ